MRKKIAEDVKKYNEKLIEFKRLTESGNDYNNGSTEMMSTQIKLLRQDGLLMV